MVAAGIVFVNVPAPIATIYAIRAIALGQEQKIRVLLAYSSKNQAAMTVQDMISSLGLELMITHYLTPIDLVSIGIPIATGLMVRWFDRGETSL